MSVASAVSAVKRAVVPDPVAGLALRTSDCAADIASTEAEKSAASAALTAAERVGDVRAGDDAARRVEVATARLVRLGVRRQALALATKEADAARMSEEKAARIKALKAKLVKAAASCDETAEALVAVLVATGEALREHRESAAIERETFGALAKENGVPWSPEIGLRGMSSIEEAARKNSNTMASVEVRIPDIRKRGSVQ